MSRARLNGSIIGNTIFVATALSMIAFPKSISLAPVVKRIHKEEIKAAALVDLDHRLLAGEPK